MARNIGWINLLHLKTITIRVFYLLCTSRNIKIQKFRIKNKNIYCPTPAYSVEQKKKKWCLQFPRPNRRYQSFQAPRQTQTTVKENVEKGEEIQF